MLSPFLSGVISTNPGNRALNHEASKQKQKKTSATMRCIESFARKNVRIFGSAFVLVVTAIAAVIGFVSCGGSSTTMGPQAGSMTVTLTDPPSCKFPNGAFDHVYVSIRSVQAHTSASADDNSSGWLELAPQLNSAPMQIDLFSAASNTCLLTNLGSNAALPAGTYQQIRLLLVPNDGSGGATPSTNACGSNGFNCVVLHDGTITQLDLSSQANTGLKVPPGQVLGGPITVSAGQDVDLNIDFDACHSIVPKGNGKFGLRPVLTAEQVSTNRTGISGTILDAATNAPVVGGTALVALERKDATGADAIFLETTVDASGMFNFCPLPAGATFDVVATAINGAGVAYNATVVLSVPGGTNVGNIPLQAETGAASGPATLQGNVTAVNGGSTGTIDAAVTAQQVVTVAGGGTLMVAIPALPGSASNISVNSTSAGTCTSIGKVGANCAGYTLMVPASNPEVGVFSGGAVTFTPPAGGNVAYTVRVDAFEPGGGGTTACSPSMQTTNLNATSAPLVVTGGATAQVQELDLTACS
jgi:uncharacterized protein DUF4382